METRKLNEIDLSFIHRMIKLGCKKGQIIVKNDKGRDTDMNCDWQYKNNKLTTVISKKN